jgi:DDE superfamily endonuclease
VTLKEERVQLLELVRKKRVAARTRIHAHVLLQADSGPEGPNWTDETISEAFAVHPLTVVLDNLNTHVPASLYATFPPEEAQRLLRRLDFHHTPKHGRWLNMAAIECSGLSRQWLDRRIADKAALISEVVAWEVARNTDAAPVD